MERKNQEVFYREDEAVICDVCDEIIERKSKCSHLKSLFQEEIHRFKQIKLTD